MAGNRFATLLHRNTNKFVVILVYTLLEWILIGLLLFNSLLSYLIYRFSYYFGLKTPCLFCSRLDHLFHSNTNACFSHTRFMCDHHCAQISMLAFCYDHRKPADATHMCQECHSSHLRNHAMILTTDHLRCSCCNVQIETDSMPKPNPIPQNQPSSESESESESQSSSTEPTSGFYTSDTNDNSNNTAPIPDSNSHNLHQYHVIDEDNICLLDQTTLFSRNKAISSYSTHGMDGDEFTTKSREEIIDPFHDLISVFGNIENNKLEEEIIMLIDKEQDKIQASQKDVPISSETESRTDTDNKTEIKIETEIEIETDNETETEVTIGSEICDKELIARFQFSPLNDQAKCQANPFMDPATTLQVYQSCIFNDPFQQIQEPVSPVCRQSNICDETEDKNVQFSEIENTFENKANYEDSTECEFRYQEQVCVNQFQVEFSPLVSHFDHRKEMNVVERREASEETNRTADKTTATTTRVEEIDEPQLHDSHLDPFSDFDCSKDEGMPVNSFIEAEDKSDVLEIGPVKSLSNGENQELSIHRENNEIADDRVLEIPKSVEDMCNLDRRCVFDKRETSTESVDGSVASEFDSIDVSTIDQLKSALKDERRALNALYGELEEERSASSIAANQTMAMITRLQQEKASMQMEALHYQRMMEEQSEYDQEALHLLNDLMVKKEKEKQELEIELEMYRERERFYESKEKKSIKCCLDSTIEMAGDDDTYLDLTSEMGGDPNESEVTDINHSTSVHVLSSLTHELDNLEDSLADFEEERISILENLRVLMEKLFAMDASSVEDYNKEGESTENGNLSEGNCCKDRDGFKRKHWSRKGKQLLPLFDAALRDNGSFSCNQHDVGPEQNKYGLLIEEMDLVYERLQILETDREFLKHSIKSMNNGSEGMDLLKEILQHLRNLRKPELHIRNSSNHLSSFSF